MLHSASYNSAGTLIITASSDGTTKIWNAKTGACIRTLIAPFGRATSFGEVPPLAVLFAIFNASGTQVVTAYVDGNSKIWDITTAQCMRTLAGHDREVCSAHFNPHETDVVVTASGDDTAKVWHLNRIGKLSFEQIILLFFVYQIVLCNRLQNSKGNTGLKLDLAQYPALLTAYRQLSPDIQAKLERYICITATPPIAISSEKSESPWLLSKTITRSLTWLLDWDGNGAGD